MAGVYRLFRGGSIVTKEEVSFSFGKNWEDYVKTSFNDERVQIAKRHLLRMLKRNDLTGMTFLDIGCGSGLHSYAAYQAGARQIISIDVDEHSVMTTARVREMTGNPPNWRVLHGSVLDADFMSSLGPADIVYSWGVLHHTGDLWQALRNAAAKVKPGGLLYIALYEKTKKYDYWVRTKKRYNASSKLGKLRMELSYLMFNFVLAPAAAGGPKGLINAITYLADYQTNRGMSVMTDVRDWLGGWPYEPASPEEITDFCIHTLGFRMQKIRTGEANVEYLFQKSDTGFIDQQRVRPDDIVAE